jgi:hypothetical protein
MAVTYVPFTLALGVLLQITVVACLTKVRGQFLEKNYVEDICVG